MEQSAYKIIRNENDRKILVLNTYVDVENSPEFSEDQFDIVYLNTSNMSSNEIHLLLEKTSPIFSTKCWMKPRFIQSNQLEKLGRMRVLIDGLARTPFDDIVTQRSEDIYQQIKRLGIKQLASVSTYVAFFIRLCKYAISRNIYTYTSTVVPGMTEGHSSFFAALLSNHEVATRKEFLEFNQKLIDMGYAEPIAFVERVHICNHCKSSHLIYAECCPKCGSSYIKEEPMLHHFRCANISPESSYLYDDRLRCPKCKQYLRHIGVDYDRPADVHTCGECGHTFMHTIMKVHCTNCGATHKPSALQPADIIRYKYTEEGIRSIINNDALIKIGKDLWFGYSDFDAYLQQLRLFSHTSQENENLYTIRLHMRLEEGMREEDRIHLLQRMHEVFYKYNFSFKNNYYFLSAKSGVEEENDSQHAIEWRLENKLQQVKSECPFMHVQEQALFIREPNENIERYIRRMCEPIHLSEE